MSEKTSRVTQCFDKISRKRVRVFHVLKKRAKHFEKTEKKLEKHRKRSRPFLSLPFFCKAPFRDIKND